MQGAGREGGGVEEPMPRVEGVAQGCEGKIAGPKDKQINPHQNSTITDLSPTLKTALSHRQQHHP